MKLAKLTLSGFRSHYQTEVMLQEYTCIIGRNDCGKSAFLRAIRLLLDPALRAASEDLSTIEPRLEEVAIEGEFCDVPAGWELGTGQTLRLRRIFRAGNSRWEVQRQVPRHPVLKELQEGRATKSAIQNAQDIDDAVKARLAGLPGGKVPTEDWKHFYADLDAAELIEKEEGWGAVDAGQLAQHFQVVFLSADTKVEEQTGGAKSVFDELGGILLREAAASNTEIAEKTAELQALLDDLVKRDDEGKWAYPPLNRLDDVLRAEISGFDDRVTLLQEAVAPRLADHRFGMSLDVEDERTKGVANMGHGLRRSILFAMLRTLVRMPEIKREVAQGNLLEEQPQRGGPFRVFLIEEPELYLHPQAERVRMEELRKLSEIDQTQVILCTHSAFFVEVASPERILRFARAGKGQTTIRTWQGEPLSENEKAWLKAQRFFADGAAGMLFADLVVLCEGDTERLCVPTLAQRLGVYDPAVEIVDCGGAGNMGTYQTVLEAFDVPYVMWLDADIGNNDKGQHARPILRNAFKNRTLGLGSIVVNRRDWEELAELNERNGEKPRNSYRKFVENGAPCPPGLERSIRAVFARQDLDDRTAAER